MSDAGVTAIRSSGRQWLALLGYGVVVLGLTAVALAMVSSLLDAHAALDRKRALLARLDRQTKRAMGLQGAASAAVNRPPFLSGKTITIAGAEMQQRVEDAIRTAGGSVLSSQIDLQGSRSAEGFIGLTENLEIQQAALQSLLYDLEAGMPYLFVENLAIQAPQAFGEAEGTPMRVLLGVSGQWREPK